MEKTEMMKRYEAETGKKSTRFVTDGIHSAGIEVWHYEYLAWLEAKAAAYDRIMGGGRKTLKEWANLFGMVFVVDQEGYGFAYKDTPVCYDEDGGWDSVTGVYSALIPPDLIDFTGDWTTSLTKPDGWEE